MRRVNPRGGIPTIVIDDQTYVGFSESGVQHMINSAARKRAQRQ
jgi:hypothetical protein